VTDTDILEILDAVERFADGQLVDSDRSAARKQAQCAAQGREVTRRPTIPKWQRRIASAVYYAAAREATEAIVNAWQLAAEAMIFRAGGFENENAIAARVDEEVRQAELLRDIFGNPFRPVAFDPRWRSADAVGLARGLYEERAFDRLPLLVDALMDAGCADEQVIGHCRGEGPHVRGCWVVDLVLGKD
jgi:hypothetical protein